MKYLIISDIHGSSEYLKKVLETVSDYDSLIILGDILYHGPRNDLPNSYKPKEVIQILNENKEKIIAIRGNCDAKVDLTVLEFNVYDSVWLKTNGKKIFLTHGDVYNKDNLPKKFKQYSMLYGHFHINEITVINDRVKAINVGSLSIPKDSHHSYAILEDSKLICYDLLKEEKIKEIEI